MAEALPVLPGELRRFTLEQQPVRGFRVQLGPALRELRRYRQHEPPVEALLGEAVSAAVLLAATLKFHGTLTLQINSEGPVSLLVAQCTHDLQVRAMVHSRPLGSLGHAADFQALVGAGRLAVTVEAQERAARYQGVVALDGSSLAACLEAYFATSEQLPTRLRLGADAVAAGGILLQKLPERAGEAAGARSQATWEQLQGRLQQLAPLAVRQGTVDEVLPTLCGPYDCRVFDAAPVRCTCRCSQERVGAMLRSLGIEELRVVLAAQGAVTVTCEFCGRPYRYDAVDVERLCAGGLEASPDSIN